MKLAFRIIGIVLLVTSLSSHATAPDLTGYQDAEGAISVAYKGDFIDPYFATRALLTARQAGLDITGAARAWITWLLPRQDSDGLFSRFCREDSGAWKVCADADADDALLAMWMEMLYVVAPCEGLPPDWKASANLAGQGLSRLLDKQRGIYQISENNQVGLLMDNIEIYAAFRAISARQNCMHAYAQSRLTQSAATQLLKGINRVFRPAAKGDFRISTQPSVTQHFYPEKVAQIYPLLYRLPTGQAPRVAFQHWIQAYGSEWLSQKNDDYPWGLVALTAQQTGDADTPQCWLKQSANLRHGEHWNVLEEIAFQSIHRSTQEKDFPCPQE